jgi:putative transposase
VTLDPGAVDEWSRECTQIDVAPQLDSDEGLERLSWLIAIRRVPDHVRSDNGSEFMAKALRDWLWKLSAKTLNIELDSPWGEQLRGTAQRQVA